jgi:hypothetical protein
MTTIDSNLLATVTGGRQQQQAPQQQQQQAQPQDGGDDQGQAQAGQGCQMGGGNFLSSIMGFLQSPQFGQIVSTIGGLVSQFSGHGQQQQQQQQQ